MIAIMSDNLIKQLLAKAEHKQTLEQNAYLFHCSDKVEQVFIVEQGAVELIRPQRDGNPIILQRAGHMTILAEASVYSNNYHCDALAVTPAIVSTIPKSKFLSHLANDKDLSHLWSSHLAAEMQKARYRSEILSRKTVAERLDAWLDLHDNTLPPKGEWKSIAIQIGVSPEALYRELSKRK